MSSFRDVARLAGVSVGTVSRFFNNPESVSPKTRGLIQPVVEQLNYAPNLMARNLRRGRTGLIMVIVWEIGDPFYGDVLHGISRVAEKKGFTVHVKEARHVHMAPADLSDIVLSRQADGAILLGGPSPFDLSDAFEAHPRHPPLVAAGESAIPSLQALPSVKINGFRAAEELTRLVLGYGHRHVAFIGGETDSVLMHDREAGFRGAMSAAGLLATPERFAAGHLTVAGARRATRELLSTAIAPTAIVCANDEMALGVLAEARAMGLHVPGDLSVVGFDDIRYAEIASPPLTTVRQPAEVIGEQSFHLLFRMLQGEQRPASIVVPHQIVVRESAAPPKN